ncbi:MAG TPA: CHAP domain-containing protein [Ktedonobacterales bacterium]|nr:CHAP domain-containing protein [Ktedonobacterales bacterium]
MLATSAPWKSGARWLSVALLGSVALGYAGASTPKNTNAASASTRTFTISTDTLESQMYLSAPHKLPAPPKPPAPKKKTTTGTKSSSGSGSGSPTTFYTPGLYNPWAAPPGHPSYAIGDFAGDPYSSVYGQCVWYAWYRHRSLPLLKLGVSGQWVANARRLGLRVGYSPWVGATVVFQPNVQGASSSGHVGVVEQILAGGWFLISEMNFYFNGGGFGRVSYRYVHVGSGVAFIS